MKAHARIVPATRVEAFATHASSSHSDYLQESSWSNENLADDDLGPLYAKQFAAQSGARQASGNLSTQELAALGIGKADRVLSRREKVQQVRRVRAVDGMDFGAAWLNLILPSLPTCAHASAKFWLYDPGSCMRACILAKLYQVQTYTKLR